MPVTFPLDKIPGLPNIAVSLITDQVLKFINKIQSEIEKVISDAAKLPDGCDCDNPDVQDLLKRIKDIQKLIAKILELVPVLDKIIKTVKILIGVANAIKASVFLTPIVGQAALLGELAIVQNMIIANAGIAVKQLSVIPPSIKASLESTLFGLAGVVAKLDSVCTGNSNDGSGDGSGDGSDGGSGGDGGVGTGISVNQALQNAIDQLDYSDSIPEKTPAGQWTLVSGDGIDGNGDSDDPTPGVPPFPKSPYVSPNSNVWVWSGEMDPGSGIAWGSEQSRKDDETMGSEFYTEINVGIEDLKAQVSSIEDIVEQQQSLLKSLQEAPAQSYSGDKPPETDLGKPGDYFIDTVNKNIYGPKTSNGWPSPVKF